MDYLKKNEIEYWPPQSGSMLYRIDVQIPICRAVIFQFYRRQEFDYWYRKSTEKLTAEGNDYEG